LPLEELSALARLCTPRTASAAVPNERMAPRRPVSGIMGSRDGAGKEEIGASVGALTDSADSSVEPASRKESMGGPFLLARIRTSYVHVFKFRKQSREGIVACAT
jgi:hypothetical protein